jgi:Archaeal holliday junction resolvase (hjc)
MPNPQYQKGVRFERRAKLILEEKGYYVMRAAGSHSAFDLIAINHERILLIQLKSFKIFAPERKRFSDSTNKFKGFRELIPVLIDQQEIHKLFDAQLIQNAEDKTI